MLVGIYIWTKFRLKKFNKYDAFGIFKQLWLSSILIVLFEIITIIATTIGTAWFWYGEEYWIAYYYWQTLHCFAILYVEIPSIFKFGQASTKTTEQDMKTPELDRAQWMDIVGSGLGM